MSDLITQLKRALAFDANNFSFHSSDNFRQKAADQANARTAPLIEGLLAVAECAQEELRVFRDGGTESEQTRAILGLQNALTRMAALAKGTP